MILRYDGSLTGFLCLAGKAIKEHLKVTKVIRNDQPATGDLFQSEIQIETDRAWAAKVEQGFDGRLGKNFMTQIALALFSEEQGIELDLIQLLGRGLKEDRRVIKQLADPLVNRVERAALRTRRERHRLLGLLRFSQLADESYLARIKPTTNVVPLIGSHFSKRLGEQRWLIIDMQRNIGIWGTGSGWELVENIEIPSELPLHRMENEITLLWKNFYHRISNADRYNPKLRQQFMPKKYWQYLTEMQSDSA